MKKPICEVCSGTTFSKEDGMFVCQDCGLKYAPADFKKLMDEDDGQPIGGNREMSPRMANLYERARKSLEVDDLEHAAEYYKQILDENPRDWEAYFYSYLGETVSFTNAQAASVAAKLGSTIPAAYDYAAQSGDRQEVDERVKLITQHTIARLTNIAKTAESLLRQYEGGSIFSPTGSVHNNLYQNLRPIAQNTIINCVLTFEKLDNKLETLYRRDGACSELAYAQSVLNVRRAQYTVAGTTFFSSAGVRDCMVKQEVLAGYLQKVTGTEQYYNTVVFRTQQQQWTESQDRFRTYWEEHAEEKAEILRQKKELEQQRTSAAADVEEARAAVANVAAEGNASVLAEQQYAAVQARIRDLTVRLNQTGMFKSKERQEIQEQIAQENAKLNETYVLIGTQRAERDQRLLEKMGPLKATLEERQALLSNIEQQIKALEDELTRDR